MKQTLLIIGICIGLLLIGIDLYTDYFFLTADVPAIVGIVAPIILLAVVIVWQIKRNM